MKKGFTLIELLVVIAIIGILSAIGLVSLNGAREKARDAQAKSDLGQMRTALTLFADDNGGEYPGEGTNGQPDASGTGSGGGLGVWAASGAIIGPYLSSELESPSSTSYSYLSNSGAAPDTTGTDFVLYYQLESGAGDHIYSLLADGTVRDYDDGDTNLPCCQNDALCHYNDPDPLPTDASCDGS
ncbi:MAG: type II secretion system protein [Candidatus Nomurabacteria bacterium]|nr:MAG: type II secretion system protein [Candidatus Nomurabacteria bacterium]